MYPSDRMKTLTSFFKDYDKNIVFRDCQMHFFYYLNEKNGDSVDFHPSFC